MKRMLNVVPLRGESEPARFMVHSSFLVSLRRVPLLFLFFSFLFFSFCFFSVISYLLSFRKPLFHILFSKFISYQYTSISQLSIHNLPPVIILVVIIEQVSQEGQRGVVGGLCPNRMARCRN